MMYEKYETSLRMLDQIILTPEDEKARRRELFEELVEYILANFTPPSDGDRVECKAAVDEVLGTHAGNRMPSKEAFDRIRQIPPIVAEVVWPVYMLRLLVSDLRIHPGYYDSRSPFNRWALRYAHIIIY